MKFIHSIMSVDLYFCLLIYACLFVHMPSACLCLCLSVCLSMCLSACLFVCLSVCLSILYACLSVHLPVSLSLCVQLVDCFIVVIFLTPSYYTFYTWSCRCLSSRRSNRFLRSSSLPLTWARWHNWSLCFWSCSQGGLRHRCFCFLCRRLFYSTFIGALLSWSAFY